MAQYERYDTRDMSYSIWHRHPNLPKYLSFVDIDACEYCDKCKAPLALVELAMDVGQPHKTATVTRILAMMAGVPAYVVLYSVSDKITLNGKSKHYEITGFRMKQIAPTYSDFKMVTPTQYIRWLEALRHRHKCNK